MDLIYTAHRPHLLGRAPLRRNDFWPFWIISFEFVKVFWACFSSWERFIGFLADASLRGRRKKGRGRGWGREKSAKEVKRGKGNPPLFSLPPYPLPLSTLMLNTISTILACLFTVGIPEPLGILQTATAIAIYLRQLLQITPQGIVVHSTAI